MALIPANYGSNLEPRPAAATLKKIYFAGKVDSYRSKLFGDESIMEVDISERAYESWELNGDLPYPEPATTVHGGKCIYAGPVRLVGDASSFYHSSEIEDYDTEKKRGYLDTFLNGQQKGAVANCFEQIDEADAVHAYIDCMDCPGTLAELGYASAKGKPIHIVFQISSVEDEPLREFTTNPLNDPWEYQLEQGHHGIAIEEVEYIQRALQDFCNDEEFIGYDSNCNELFTCQSHEVPGNLIEWKTRCDHLLADGKDYQAFIRLPKSNKSVRKDEFWFIKNLPGVTWEYGIETSIKQDWFHYPPKQKTAAEPAKPQKPKPCTPKQRLEVLVRDSYRCRMCGAAAADGATLEVDHIIPRAEGGESVLWNLQTLCDECNRGKGAQIVPIPPR